MKFKLNTQLRNVGRIRGWNVKCDLDDTMKSVMEYNRVQIPALIAAIVKELAKARDKYLVCEGDLRSERAKRGTRFGKNAAARYDRVTQKISELERALSKLQAEVI